jgi:serine/threonine-protein kinase HipA
MCQALAMHPVNKYQSDGGPGPTRIVDLLRRHVAFERVAEAVDGFVGALAFNWIIAGPDAHAKNYAVLMAGGDVRLAPFYDIASALAYREFHEPKVKLAMKVGRYYRLASITRSSWQHLAQDLHLDANRLCAYVADLASRTPDAFAVAVSDPAVVRLRSELPARLVDRVSSRARRLGADMQP